MGRWYLWSGGRVAILLSQTGGEPERARSCVSLGDDPQPTHGLQSTSESQTRRPTTENHSARHAECADATGDGMIWSAATCRRFGMRLIGTATVEDGCDRSRPLK